MLNRRDFLARTAAGLSLGPILRAQRGADDHVAFVGSYTRTTGKGIQAWRFRPSTGDLAPLGLVAETPDPSWLIAHPNGRFLYAVNEMPLYNGLNTGAVSAFVRGTAHGSLTPLNRVLSGGLNPSHLAMDPGGRWLIVANYGSATDTAGAVSVFGIRTDGSLEEKPHTLIQHSGSGTHPTRQMAAHAHAVVLSPNGRSLLVPDLGANRIVMYRWDGKTGALTPAATPFVDAPVAGAGPRHAAFSRDSRFAFVNHELNSTVTSYRFDEGSGRLTPLTTVSTLPADFKEQNSTAEIEIHPNGRTLYISNRGHNSIAVFRIGDGGVLSLIGHTPTGGSWPRSFKIDPTGAYMMIANQRSDSVNVLRIDPGNGLLTSAPQVLNMPTPACVLFLPA
jgi:6-phosphogluconolactonase